ncbi:MAG: SPOR domain-containing protein [Pseudomonadota bacterium]
MMRYPLFSSPPLPACAAVLSATLMLGGCEETGGFGESSFFGPGGENESGETRAGGSGETVERDVEAPDVFATTEAGLWDGRPSLGGIWVAHPDVAEPERVVIRNEANGESTVGALFRRARETPGPRLQVSSDAAEALGILAGAPVSLEVVALRTEEVEVEPDEPEIPAKIAETDGDPIASSEAAIEAAEPATAAQTAAAGLGPVTITTNLPEVSLARPYLQAGVFKSEENANRAVKELMDADLAASARPFSPSSGDQIWRVVVGPASTPEERDAILEKVKAAGYADAYPVPQ